MLFRLTARLLLAGASIVPLALQSAYAATFGPPRNPGICLAETALNLQTETGRRWHSARDSQEMLAAIDPKSSLICQDWLYGEMVRARSYSDEGKDKNCFIISDEMLKAAYVQKAAMVDSCQTNVTAQGVIAFNPTLSTLYQEAVTREATAAKEAAKEEAERATQIAAAAEERKLAEERRLKAQKAAKTALIAGVTGPMLCMVDGKSKPTLYLDLGGNDEFKLVRDGHEPVAGKWGMGLFQGANAIYLVSPASSKDRFPDLYTAYENSIKIDQDLTSLTLARRSTFPGSLSAEAYEAVCEKVKSLSLGQAQQLTGSNLKNNPIRPDALAKRQKEAANRPSADYCTKLEDTYADRPVLQRQLLEKMGCN